MPEDTRKRGAQDPRTAAADETFDVEFFARKHGLTVDQARIMIAKIGADRAAGDGMAERVDRRG